MTPRRFDTLPAYLDHLAVAAETWDALWPRYRADLGGEWVAGGEAIGFASAQLRFANAMKVEALAPCNWERNDFLRRFLDHRGPGVHHMTFKVPDIHAALAASEAAGYRPVGVDVRDPGWMEAFLHPKDAPGVVIQLVQAANEWSNQPPANFPAPRCEPATLDYIGHALANLDDGVRLYRDLLGGTERAAGDGWVEFTWPKGGGVIRLLHRPDLTDGVHHVAFTTTEPETVRDAKPADADGYEVAPEVNLGVRLLLRGVTA